MITSLSHNIPNIIKLIMLITQLYGIENTEIYIAPIRNNIVINNAYIDHRGTESFTLFIKEDYLINDDLHDGTIRLFLHELCHVKQVLEGKMQIDRDNNRIIWNGRQYSSKQPDEGRWWEVEANRAERKYLKTIKQILKESVEIDTVVL